MENVTGYKRPGVFLPDQVLAAFNANYLDADACRLWILERIHGKTPACLKCYQPIKSRQLERFLSGGRLKCGHCQGWISATSGTFLAGCQLILKKSREKASAAESEKGANDFRPLFLMAVLLAVGLDDKKIAAAVKVDPETVRLRRRFFAGLESLPTTGQLRALSLPARILKADPAEIFGKIEHT